MATDYSVEDGVLVATPEGTFSNVVSEEVTGKLRDAPEITGLVLDLSKTKVMASAGVAGLVGLNDFMDRRGGKLVLCALADVPRNVLDLTNLLQIFTVVDTVTAAKKEAAG